MYTANPYQQYQKQASSDNGESERVAPPSNNIYAKPAYVRPEYTMRQPIITAEIPTEATADSGSNPFQKYKEQSLSTLAPGELLVRLYDELIKQMRVASMQTEKKNFQAANDAFNKSQTILATLESSLDMEYELSENLRELYVFMAKQLMQANVKKDVSLVESCIPLARDLRDSFDQADKSTRKLQHVPVGESVG